MEATKVRNTLKDKKVQVREGNAGVTRLVSTLKPGASTTISTDPNATYKEFIMMTLPDNTKLPVLSSDDFADFLRHSWFKRVLSGFWVTMPGMKL